MGRLSNEESKRREMIEELRDLYSILMSQCKELLASKQKREVSEGRQCWKILLEVNDQIKELENRVSPETQPEPETRKAGNNPKVESIFTKIKIDDKPKIEKPVLRRRRRMI